jgi:hypothetical protein
MGSQASRIAILAFALVALSGCAREPATPAEPEAGPVRFVREHVIVRPSEGRTIVSGVYYFRNDSDDTVSVAMRYPFPIDRFHIGPFRVRAWEKRSGVFEPMGFTPGEYSMTWRLSFKPREEKIVRAEYAQEIKRHHAVYIVTTTRQWGRPLERAEFEFRVPRGLDEVKPSFEPTRVEERADTVVYYLERTDFMPDSDLSVTWR